jgi:hypothetical protein
VVTPEGSTIKFFVKASVAIEGTLWKPDALTGENPEQVLFLLLGSGQNGKSTFLETLRAMLGAYGMGGGVRWGGMGTATSSTISNGTLALDIYDPAHKQLLWTGRATKALDPSQSQEKNQKNLNKVMQKLLKNFPPK